MSKSTWSIWLLCGLLFTSNAFAGDSELEQKIQAEVDTYISALQAQDLQTVTQAAHLVSASGLSDKRLFSTVEKTLRRYHLKQTSTPGDSSLVPVVIALIRALAASGEPSHSDFLYQIQTESQSRAARNRAKHVISKVSWYRYRNDVMQDTSAHKPSQSIRSTRFLNLLTHPDKKLNRYGAEELYRLGSAESVVLDQMMSTLGTGAYQDPGGYHIDAMAWYCRTLIKIDYSSYKAQIDAIAKDRKVPKKIRRHCGKEIKKLER